MGRHSCGREIIGTVAVDVNGGFKQFMIAVDKMWTVNQQRILYDRGWHFTIVLYSVSVLLNRI